MHNLLTSQEISHLRIHDLRARVKVSDVGLSGLHDILRIEIHSTLTGELELDREKTAWRTIQLDQEAVNDLLNIGYGTFRVNRERRAEPFRMTLRRYWDQVRFPARSGS